MPDIHTHEGKTELIRTLCDRIRDVTIERVPSMPEEWDGLELRQYLADLFAAEITASIKSRLQARHGRGLKDYRNTIAITPCL